MTNKLNENINSIRRLLNLNEDFEVPHQEEIFDNSGPADNNGARMGDLKEYEEDEDETTFHLRVFDVEEDGTAFVEVANGMGTIYRGTVNMIDA